MIGAHFHLALASGRSTIARMKPKILCLLALLACLTGCVPVDSLNPLYTDKDIVFDESLLGVWVGPNNGEDGGLKFSRFVQDGQKGYVQKGYVLTMFDGNKKLEDAEKMVFHAFLIKLDGREFLDAVLQDDNPEPDSYSLQIKSTQSGTRIEPQLIKVGAASYFEFGTSMPGDNGRFQAQLRPAHWLMKITRNREKLKLEYADDDDFKKAVQSGGFHLPAAILGEGKNQRVVITATTQELQRFVLEHADDGTFFNSPTDELHRQH